MISSLKTLVNYKSCEVENIKKELLGSVNKSLKSATKFVDRSTSTLDIKTDTSDMAKSQQGSQLLAAAALLNSSDDSKEKDLLCDASLNFSAEDVMRDSPTEEEKV